MSEMTQERMREYLDCLEDKVSKCNCENPLDPTMIEGECVKAINAIRALIEHRPEVSMRFVREFADYILAHFSYWIPKESHDYQTKKKDVEHEILTAFRKAGVKVKEADDE